MKLPLFFPRRAKADTPQASIPIYLDFAALIYACEVDLQQELSPQQGAKSKELLFGFTGEFRRTIVNDIINNRNYQEVGIVKFEDERTFIRADWLLYNINYISAFAPKSEIKKHFMNYMRKGVQGVVDALAAKGPPGPPGYYLLVPNPGKPPPLNY